jgi:uncharacterized protein YhfF
LSFIGSSVPTNCSVTAYNPANGVYAQSANSAAVIFTFTAEAQSLVTITNVTLSTAGNNTFTLTAIGGSGTDAYVFQTSSAGCSISGDTLSFIGSSVPTNCSVTAYNPANGVYAQSANSAAVIFTFTAEAQSLVTITNVTLSTAGNNTFTLTAIGGSGTDAYVFQTSSAGCSISGDTLSFIGSSVPTNCSVTAYNPANGVYAQSANSAAVIFTFTAEAQSLVTITNVTLSTAGNNTFTLTAIGGSGTDAYVFQTSSAGCSISGDTLSFIGSSVPTNCSVTAYNPANGVYAQSANSAAVIFTFTAEAQSLVTITNVTLSTAGNNTFTLTANGGSGTDAYVFQTSSAGCSISGDTLSFIGSSVPTNCSVTAYNPANGVYAQSANSAAVIFTFTAEAQSLVTITNVTLSTAGNNTFTLTANGGSGTDAYVFQTSSAGCSISGDTLSFIGSSVPTNCSVTAYNPANGVYAQSANSAAVIFTFTAIGFTVTFAPGTGGSGSMSPETYAAGANQALTANGFTNPGYNFAGWSTTGPNGPEVYYNQDTITITANVTLTALWTPAYFTVTFAPGTGGSGSMSPETYAAGANQALTANGFTNPGYNFAGWSTTGPNGPEVYYNQDTITITANVTLTALWTVRSGLDRHGLVQLRRRITDARFTERTHRHDDHPARGPDLGRPHLQGLVLGGFRWHGVDVALHVERNAHARRPVDDERDRHGLVQLRRRIDRRPLHRADPSARRSPCPRPRPGPATPSRAGSWRLPVARR